ncbi:MAG TPA: von Willebrand factor type A domain-containing protein [Flavitalea sp.]|nr:von Willebrand factor type A domain-containing protein [Flavitalea sp.]
MKYIIFALMISVFPVFSIFTTVVISGRVTDLSDGLPVSGATVKWKGTTTAVTTGPEGKFSIKTSQQSTTLVISMVGYKTQEIKIENVANALEIKLRAISSNLEKEEAVVTAMGIETLLQAKVPGIAVHGKKGLYRQALPNQSIYFPEPEFNTEDYDHIIENRFLETSVNPLSTFSIDVDGASYSNVRRFLHAGQLPPAGAVRVEELINYFHYDYPAPKGDDPFSINTEMADCPWNKENKLVIIGLQGKNIPVDDLSASNLVFLIDVSGSMQDENKLPLVKSSIKLLVEQLREKDQVSMVVYAGNAGLVLPSTSGADKVKIMSAINDLEAGGSTAGGAGIQLAYKIAKQNFIRKGNNRVILCTDGDFNVGLSSDASLVELIEKEKASGVYLTVLGYGMGNYKDNKMQQLADKGNGNHAYIDNINEAKKVLVNEFGGTLFTIAKDVKLQVEFNPAKVQAYRLVGYENRMLNKEDFNNDTKDAGEIGSGHTVTALYELIPAGVKSEFIEKTDPLKYSSSEKPSHRENDEIMNIKFRYKKPDAEKSMLIEHPVENDNVAQTSDNFRFAAAVAQFGMLLNNSIFKQGSSFENAKMLASGAIGDDDEGYRQEFLTLIRQARKLYKDEIVSKK